MARRRDVASLLTLVLLAIGWIVLLYFVRPTEIVEKMSPGSAYLLLLAMAFFGALTSLTSFTVYPALVTLTLGGLDPFLLALTSGVGLIVGDLLFLGLVRDASELLPDKHKQRAQRFSAWLGRRSDRLIAGVVYVYVAFTPFPNNLLTATLGILKYPFKKAAWPLALGDATLAAVTVILAGKF